MFKYALGQTFFIKWFTSGIWTNIVSDIGINIEKGNFKYRMPVL